MKNSQTTVDKLEVKNEINYYTTLLLLALESDVFYSKNHANSTNIETNEVKKTLALLEQQATNTQVATAVKEEFYKSLQYFDSATRKTRIAENQQIAVDLKKSIQSMRFSNNPVHEVTPEQSIKIKAEIASVASQIATAYFKAVHANAYIKNPTHPLPFVERNYESLISFKMIPHKKTIFMQTRKMIEAIFSTS